MEKEVKETIDKIGREWEQLKKDNDALQKELKAKGSADVVLKEKIDKQNEALTKLTEDRDALFKQLEEVKTAMSRTDRNGGANPGAGGEEAELKAAFRRYMAKGEVTEILRKSLSDDSDPDGGFLVRPELSARIVKKVFETSPIRQLADVQTITSDSLDAFVDYDEVDANWVSERGSRTTSNTAQLKLKKILAQEIYAMPQATQRLLDDAAFDVEAWLAAKVADKFARKEATAFVTGNGVGQPMGFQSYASGTSYGQIEQVVSGNATLLQPDGLITLQNSLKEPYQAGAVWLMQRITVASVRKFKDNQNRYLWEPSLVPGNPDMLLGKPLIKAADIPAEGSGNLAAAYGDFKQGYQIVDRAGIRTLRDPFSNKPFVQFYTTRRVGGDVVNFEAIKLAKCST